MTVLEKNQDLLKLTAPVTGRTLKEDGTVVNLADLAADASALTDPVTGLPIGQGSTGGAAHVTMPGGVEVTNPYGDNLSDDLWGNAIAKEDLLAAEPIRVFDLTSYSKDEIYFGLIPSAAVETYTVTLTWSKDGTEDTDHSSTEIISAVAGNSGAVVTKKDNFCHVLIAESAMQT